MKHRAISFCAVLALAAVVAAGCGADTASNTNNGDPSGTVAPPAVSGNSDVTIAASGPPKQGGKLIYGLEADTDGFDPAVNRWSASGLIMAGAVFDPIAAYDKDQKARPFLAESFSSSKDFKTWTIKLRSGIKFHNGEALTADAVGQHITRIRQSPLTGAAMDAVDPAKPVTKIDELTLEVHMTTPWVAFPVSMTGQGGMVPAPAVMNNPDTAYRATTPIGTGPFKFKEWTPNERFSATRNDEYWQKGMPYLNEVEFKPLPDAQTRVSALEKGDVQMLFTTVRGQMDRLGQLAKQGKAQVINDNGEQEELSLMFNMAEAPMDDVRVRKAVAYAVDLDAYSAASGDDPSWQTSSLFSPSSPWYVKTDFPRYDVAKAKALVEEYEKEKGPIKMTVTTTDTSDSLAIGQAFVQMLQAVGIEADANSYPQSEMITQVLFGRYDVAYWRQFGSPDPDGDYQWWVSKNAVPPGEGRLGLNFARLKDPQVDEALDKARQNEDPAVRKEAYAKVQQRFAELVPYVWLDVSVKVIGADPKVRNITNGPLPDGTPAMPITGGVTRLTQVWIDT